MSADKKYKLVPDKDGTYTLKMWIPGIKMYLTEAVYVTPERADGIIKNLEREVIYYRQVR